jgi:hypothetical protein
MVSRDVRVVLKILKLSIAALESMRSVLEEFDPTKPLKPLQERSQWSSWYSYEAEKVIALVNKALFEAGNGTLICFVPILNIFDIARVSRWSPL